MMVGIDERSALAHDSKLRRHNSFAGHELKSRTPTRHLSSLSHSHTVHTCVEDVNDSEEDAVDSPPSPPPDWLASGAPRVPNPTPAGTPHLLRRWDVVPDLSRCAAQAQGDGGSLPQSSPSRNLSLVDDRGGNEQIAVAEWFQPPLPLSSSGVSASTVRSHYEDESGGHDDHDHEVSSSASNRNHVMTWEEAFARADARRLAHAAELRAGGEANTGNVSAAVMAPVASPSREAGPRHTNHGDDEDDDGTVSPMRSRWRVLCALCIPALRASHDQDSLPADWADAERSLQRLERMRLKTRRRRRKRYEDDGDEVPLLGMAAAY
jgi:hypothetical protein